MYYLVTILLWTLLSPSVIALKLLVVFPTPGKSHYILGNSLGKGLAKAGHEVTFLGAFSDPKPPKNYKEIVVKELAEFAANKDNKESATFNLFDLENVPMLVQLPFMENLGNQWSDLFLGNEKVQELLKSNEHFDAVIIEQFWNDAMKVLAYHFKAHLILFSTMGPTRWVNNLVANPEPPSYVPDVLFSVVGEMSFLDRIYNLMFAILSDLHLKYRFYPQQASIMNKHYANAPTMDEVLYNVSLVLTNSHESIGQAVPHVPNMIDVGGYHVNPPKELPKDIKEFMEGAKDGVIYFSMGSNLVPSLMPKDKKDAILKILGSRKEKVLWKWDEDQLDNKPDNVFIAKWFPQQAILGHPNCKLFITHGGLLSTTETVYMGVPVLGFPIFGDQKLNAARATQLGFGKSITFSKITEDNVREALNELLDNPKYRANAKHRSSLLHDRPVKPMDMVNYWVEYVVRHRGAEHLRVAGVHLPLYKYLMLDVAGAILGVLILSLYISLKVCKWIIRRCSTKRKVE